MSELSPAADASESPTPTLVEAPPPGWYPDPQGPNAQRWWDGRGWAANTRSAQEAQAEAQAFAASPVGLAREAFARGDEFFQVELAINELSGRRSVFGTSGNRVKGSGGRPDILGQIENEGFRLEHVGYVFIETGATSTNRVLHTGQGTVTRGFVQGIYLFRREGD